MVAFITGRCGQYERGPGPRGSDAPSVASACFHISSPPSTSSTSLRFILVREVICRILVTGQECMRINPTCFAIGNSYGQVLQAHLLYPVSDEITSRFAHVGQKSISKFGSKVDSFCSKVYSPNTEQAPNSNRPNSIQVHKFWALGGPYGFFSLSASPHSPPKLTLPKSHSRAPRYLENIFLFPASSARAPTSKMFLPSALMARTSDEASPPSCKPFTIHSNVCVGDLVAIIGMSCIPAASMRHSRSVLSQHVVLPVSGSSSGLFMRSARCVSSHSPTRSLRPTVSMSWFLRSTSD